MKVLKSDTTLYVYVSNEGEVGEVHTTTIQDDISKYHRYVTTSETAENYDDRHPFLSAQNQSDSTYKTLCVFSAGTPVEIVEAAADAVIHTYRLVEKGYRKSRKYRVPARLIGIPQISNGKSEYDDEHEALSVS